MSKKLLSILFTLCMLLGMFSLSLCVSAEETVNVTEIGTADELIALMNDNTKWAAGNNYVLTDDIDLTGVTGQKPIGDSTYFYGNFNGAGHTIRGINISGTAGRVGLFGAIAGSTIENLTVYGEITGGNGQGIGGLVGMSDKSSTIRNCVNYCNVTATTHAESCAGGIVGFLRANHTNSTITVENCKNYGTINGTSYTGGVLGRIHITSDSVAASSDITVSECANYGLVKSEADKGQYIGGIVGHITARAEQDVTIERCLNAGDVDVAYGYIGGIAGYITVYVANGIIINDCMNSGDLYAESMGYVGGLFGYHHGTYKYKSVTTNFYNSGKISAGLGTTASYIMPITGVPRLSEFNNAYYLDDGITDSRGTKVSAAESVLADTFTGFSGDVWIIAKNGPELKTFHTHDFSEGNFESIGTETHTPVCYCGEHGAEAIHVDEDTNNICDICKGVMSCDHGSTVKTWETVSESTCSIHGVEQERCACGELTGNTRNLELNTSAHINLDYVWSKNTETALYEIVCPDCNVAVLSQTEKPTVYLTPSSLDPTGITPETGVTDLVTAVEKIAATGGTVWITEYYTISGKTFTLPTYTETITIRGNVGDSGLANTGIFNNTTAYLYLGGPTVIDKIVFKGVGTTADANKAITYIIANWNDLTLEYIRNVENSQAYIVAGHYNITESNDVAKETTVNLTGVSKVSGTTNTFYSRVYLGDVFNANGISSSDKKVTLNVKKGINHEATIDLLYTMSTSFGTDMQDCPTPGTETEINLYDGTSILRGRTGDRNAGYSDSTGHMDKLTFNFFDNSTLGGVYYIKNVAQTVLNISTEEDGRTVMIPSQFVCFKFGEFSDKVATFTVNADSHGSKYSSPARNTADEIEVGSIPTTFVYNIENVCAWDDGVITTEPTSSSSGVMTYTCTVCGKTKTETLIFECTEHIYVVKADGTYYCTNDCEVEAPKAPVIVSLAPGVVKGNEVTLTVSVNVTTPILAHGFEINAPTGFTLKSINSLLGEATTTATGWTLTGVDNTSTPCNFAVFNMSMTDDAINSAVVELVFTVADTVEYGTYVFTVDSIETFNYNEDAIETVSVDAEVIYAPEAEIILGDIDGDGIVTIKDVLTILKAILNDTSIENGDLNSDGKLSLIDVLRVMKLIAQ